MPAGVKHNKRGNFLNQPNANKTLTIQWYITEETCRNRGGTPLETWKQLLRKLLFPGTAVIFFSVPISAALLIYAFGFAHEENPLVYLSYVVSAYTLVIVCIQIVKASKKVSVLLHRNPYIHRYLTDISFRMHVSLNLSVGLNLVYAVMKLFFGVYYHSVWFGTLGVYYTLLTIMRFLLIRHANRNAFGKELMSEWKRYRLCGAILVPMTLALSGVVVLMIKKDEGFQYPGYLIYVMAMYAFYAIITAIIHIVKYRKYQSPVMTAAKVIKLAATLVSILSLETAMISQFGDSSDLLFRLAMIACTGGIICIVILVMAIYMIAHANKRLKDYSE